MSTEDNDLDNAFGTPSLERKYEGPKFVQLRSPDTRKNEEVTEYICRLLPPMKSLKDDPLGWRVYYGKHFGHFGNNARNPEKPRARPFGCIQKKNLRTKEIEIACPKCDQMEVMKGKQSKRAAEILADHPEIAAIDSEKDREKALREVCKEDSQYAVYSEWLKKHNCDRKWWMNVLTIAGTYECLGISHTTMKEVLEPKLKEWREKKKLDVFHPTKGVWLRFTRTGIKPRVKDNVELHTETVEIDGETMEKTKLAPLDKPLIARALKECPDLGKDVVTFLSAEKIKALIAAKGDLDKTDEIWGDAPRKAKATAASGSLEDAADEDTSSGSLEDAAEKVETKVEVKSEPKVESKAAAAAEDDDEDLEAQMAALKAKAAAKAAAKAKAPAKPPEDDTEDFLSSFGAK